MTLDLLGFLFHRTVPFFGLRMGQRRKGKAAEGAPAGPPRGAMGSRLHVARPGDLLVQADREELPKEQYFDTADAGDDDDDDDDDHDDHADDNDHYDSHEHVPGHNDHV